MALKKLGSSWRRDASTSLLQYTRTDPTSSSRDSYTTDYEIDDFILPCFLYFS